MRRHKTWLVRAIIKDIDTIELVKLTAVSLGKVPRHLLGMLKLDRSVLE